MKRAKKPAPPPREAGVPSAGAERPPAPSEAEVHGMFKRFGGSDGHAFNVTIVRETLATICVPVAEQDGQDRRTAATMKALAAFKPRDEIEGMLAAQAVAMHFAAMECFRRAMMPEQSSDAGSKLRRDGANLARGMTDMLDALDRKRGTAPRQQVVRVERVVVQDGGKAIVGNVDAGAAAAGATAAPAPAAVGHDALGPVLDLPPCTIPGPDAVAAGPAPGAATAPRAGEGEA